MGDKDGGDSVASPENAKERAPKKDNKPSRKSNIHGKKGKGLKEKKDEVEVEPLYIEDLEELKHRRLIFVEQDKNLKLNRKKS